MTFTELVILLPCHSLEDFPLHHEGDEAAGLLSAWTAMWHPRLIAAAESMPTWARADDPPEELEGRLLVIPEVSESLLLAGWTQRAKNEGAFVIRKKLEREEIVDAALAELGGEPPEIDAELVRDFLALGYAYLQEELLTRQMRYMSNLDEVHFQNETVAAAKAAVSRQPDKAQEHLQNCFDVLAESREQVYPAEAYLIDLTLVAPTTIGPSLRKQLNAGLPTNLLVSGATLAEMAAKEPETLAALRAAIDKKSVSVVGGEFAEGELPLLPIETVLDNFKRASKVYRHHLGKTLEIYARRRFGLSPILPQLLVRCGFSGALHFTLDDGQFPRDDQSKSSWEGVDATTIETLTRVPLDIDRPESFLNLCQTVGETMDSDHVATVTFAHWPGKSSVWYDELRRISRYAPVLGKFITLDEYFEQTQSAGAVTRFAADQYRSPYLRQSIIRRQENPLSQLADAHRQAIVNGCQQALEMQTALLRGKIDQAAPQTGEASRIDGSSSLDKRPGEEEDGRLEARLQESARQFAAALPREGQDVQPSCLVLNPVSINRRVIVDVSKLRGLPKVSGQVKAVQESSLGGGRKLAIVDVPAMGYVWIAGSDAPHPPSKEPPLGEAEENLLRNEFFELIVDPHTGAIRSVFDYRQRGNRMSQQIAYRLPGARARPGDIWRDPDETAVYSVMAADSVEVTSTGPVLGEIVSRGRLLDAEGEKLARFQQTVQVWRGSRVINLEIELEVDQEPRADPWNSYYAARFAWKDGAADMYRGVSLTRQPTDMKRLESPYFVEARTEKTRTAILTGGLPYHRRMGMRMLDTLLVVRGEKRQKFRLGIAINHPQPMAAAIELLCPVVVVDETSSPPRGATSSWLFHLDAKNVLATYWAPLTSASDVVEGFRTRLLETDGRPVRMKLRSVHRPKSARQVDFTGEPLADLKVEDDATLIEFAAYEWAEIEVRW